MWTLLETGKSLRENGEVWVRVWEVWVRVGRFGSDWNTKLSFLSPMKDIEQQQNLAEDVSCICKNLKIWKRSVLEMLSQLKPYLSLEVTMILR